ncbi:MAG: hypothetical protein MR419_02065 [Clostridiales bacterium]|nr:hypothetical protein [Clostridiales bacterium]MDY4173230.1 HlyD family efflux transporter periplasmic adaptor subunit [Evtepia sp.]
MKQQGSIFTKLAVPLAIAAIVVYLIYSAWVGVRDPYQFTVAYSDTMETSVTATGWVVRSEQPVAGAEGVVQLKRNQGEKVGKGKEIAVVYQDESYVANQDELLQVKTDLGALQYATYSESPSGSALEEQMLSAMKSLRVGSSSGGYNNLSDLSATYRKLVLRREYLVSSEATAAMDQAANALLERYNALQSSQAGATSIVAEESGLFSSYVDGYESLLTPDKLVGLSPKDLEAFSQLTPQTDANVLGKLVTDSVWYYAVVVPGESADKFSVDSKVDVFFNSLSQSLPMTIYTVGEVQDDQVVVVLRSSQDDDKAEDLRQESGRVIFRSSQGIRVPKQALRVTEEGERGVYVVLSQKARFRPVSILAEDETSYLVKAAPKNEEDTRILRAGDEVVLASEELYDGKVVR